MNGLGWIRCVAIGAMLTPSAFAQLPWNSLDGLAAKAKESVEINLDGATLQLANGLMGKGDKGKDGDAAAKLVQSLKGINVRAYEFAAAGAYDANLLRPFRDQLKAQGWSKVIDVKDGDETFELYTKSDQGKSAGFAMIAAEPKELAVIHIDGPIDISQLGSLGGQFGIPNIPLVDGAKQKQKGKE